MRRIMSFRGWRVSLDTRDAALCFRKKQKTCNFSGPWFSIRQMGNPVQGQQGEEEIMMSEIVGILADKTKAS